MYKINFTLRLYRELLMPSKHLLFLAISLVLFNACGSSSNKTAEEINLKAEGSVQSSVTDSWFLPSTFGSDRIYYVSRDFNVPHNENLVNTFPSITKALQDIASDINYSISISAPFSYSDVTLRIQEGLYGAETNESYPIVFPADLKVVRDGNVTINNVDYFNVKTREDLNDPSMLTAISILENTIRPIIKLSQNTIIDSITVSAGFGIGIMIDNDTHAILKNTTIHTSKTALSIKDDAQLTVLNANIHDNSLGLEVSDGASAIIKATKISKNDIGIQSSNISKLQFADKNIISDNIFCGLYDRGRGSDLVLSKQIVWSVPEIYNRCQNGVSIASNFDRNIIFQEVPDSIKLFSDVPEITLTYPTHKSAISTTTPDIVWVPTPDNVVTKVAIFNSLPIINTNHVINKEDIVWYWDSESDDVKKLGNLHYSDGKSNGSLIKGKGYYCVIFEMNKSQTKITAASTAHFFTVNGNF